MKTFRNIFFCLLAVLVTACNDGIDSITPVAPGADESAPVVSILYPLEGTLIRVTEDVTAIEIQLDVVDDIEIANIIVSLDGAEINKFSEFKDYRHATQKFTFAQLGNGKHTITVAATDLSGKSTSQSVSFEKVAPYKPIYNGETFYMPLDGDYMDLVSISNATKVGNPSFVDGKLGKAYAGIADAYLTFPATALQSSEFSAVFWYKLNDDVERAGILAMSAEDTAAPDAPNNRTKGFRFFRESGNGGQTFKLNAGTGAGETWFDGGAAAMLNTSDWAFMSFTISGTGCVVYINGEVVCEGNFAGIDWEGCDILSIGSGAPRFTGWNHLSENSLIDEVRLFNKALSQQEIKTIMNASK